MQYVGVGRIKTGVNTQSKGVMVGALQIAAVTNRPILVGEVFPKPVREGGRGHRFFAATGIQQWETKCAHVWEECISSE